jgi:hypothetical protein
VNFDFGPRSINVLCDAFAGFLTLLITYDRGNEPGVAGWEAIMDVLKGCTGLTALNGCDKYREILAGSLTELDLEGTEAALAVGRFLPRSASTLTLLDLKWAIKMLTGNLTRELKNLFHFDSLTVFLCFRACSKTESKLV